MSDTHNDTFGTAQSAEKFALKIGREKRFCEPIPDGFQGFCGQAGLFVKLGLRGWAKPKIHLAVKLWADLENNLWTPKRSNLFLRHFMAKFTGFSTIFSPETNPGPHGVDNHEELQ